MPRWTAARLSTLLIAALLGSAVALPAMAQWKWRDKNGQAQYSDLPPPPGIADKDILQRPAAAQRVAATPAPVASAASAPRLTPKAVEPELEARRKQVEQAEADKQKVDDAKAAATRADNCSRARTQMRTLDSGMRIARTNDKGEREILDDAGRAAETRRMQDAIAADCK